MEKKEAKFFTGQGDKGLTALTPASQVSKADERVAAALADKTIVKEIVVPGKIVNLVVR